MTGMSNGELAAADLGNRPRPPLLSGYEDQVFIVLGGWTNIGKEVARLLWDLGAHVYIIGLPRIDQEIKQRGHRAIKAEVSRQQRALAKEMPDVAGDFRRHQVTAYECDIIATDPEDCRTLKVEKLIHAIGQKHGMIHGIADTIGVRFQLPPEGALPADVARAVAVSAGYLPRVFTVGGPYFKVAGGARIVMAGSTNPYDLRNAKDAAYAAGKTARANLWAAHTPELASMFDTSIMGIALSHVDNEAERAVHGENAESVAAAARNARFHKDDFTVSEAAKTIVTFLDPFLNRVFAGKELPAKTAKAMPSPSPNHLFQGTSSSALSPDALAAGQAEHLGALVGQVLSSSKADDPLRVALQEIIRGEVMKALVPQGVRHGSGNGHDNGHGLADLIRQALVGPDSPLAALMHEVVDGAIRRHMTVGGTNGYHAGNGAPTLAFDSNGG
jgi:NAD(P)-dependent dehydrogenase (short-subunit alcohol dehydrogenase family)